MSCVKSLYVSAAGLLIFEQQESQLLAQLQPEQARLNELNERLDAAQKELEVGDKPQAGGKRQ
jgi:hypothetical protein